jgi:hypothetical protein
MLQVVSSRGWPFGWIEPSMRHEQNYCMFAAHLLQRSVPDDEEEEEDEKRRENEDEDDDEGEGYSE